ncbi:MAG: putative O-glycosylation ligase, exosortase A system-associated, partial [Burkholderiales bacterium PBB5]
MRDFLIISIVIAGSLAALRRPWIGVLLWVWLSLMNPHRYSFGLAYDAPLAAVAAACTVMGLFTTRERRSPMYGAPA